MSATSESHDSTSDEMSDDDNPIVSNTLDVMSRSTRIQSVMSESKDNIKEVVKEVIKNTTKDSTREASSGTASGTIKDTTRDTTKELKDATKDSVKDVAKESKKGGVKKGPGRPRKAPCREMIPRKGISVKPTNSESCIELLHDNPALFKKIITFFKTTATHNVQVIFRPKEIIIYAKDHYEKSRIRICIDATKINHYYCKGALDIGIALKDLEVLLNKVDRDYKAVILYSTTNNTQKNIILSFMNEMDIDEIHTIDLIGQYNHMDNEHEFLDESHMIRFEWPNKYFRKTINDIRTISSQLSITQDDKALPLTIEYVSENKKIHSKYNIKNPAKIKLQSKLQEGDTFRVEIKLDYIKSISTSHIADDIIIFLDEKKTFMTKAFIDKDNAIEIKTVTEIINIRP